jgi:hypothetical protein
MKLIKQNSKALRNGHVLLISVLGFLCILYLAATRTTEDQRLVDALEKYCYAHYALIVSPTAKNRYRFLRYEEKLARLSEGKFHHLKRRELRPFLKPRGYIFDMEEREGKVDYLLARYVEEGSFEEGGRYSISYDYLVLDPIFVYPYDHYFYDNSRKKRDSSPLIVFAKNGCVYLNGGWIRRRFTELFTCLWECKDTGLSRMRDPRWCNILYRGVQEIWNEARLYRRSKKAVRDYFVGESFDSYLPTMLACVSREYFYRHKDMTIEKKLELSYLRSLMEDPSFITLGFLCYLDEVMGESWARNIIGGLEAGELWNVGIENCSLEQLRWAARKAFEKKSGDFG